MGEYKDFDWLIKWTREHKNKIMNECKFKVGDKVRVVGYGHPLWSWDEMPGMKLISKKEDGPYWYDMSPELVGQEGIIVKAGVTQNIPQYAIDGIIGKHAWYNEEQLESVLPAQEN